MTDDELDERLAAARARTQIPSLHGAVVNVARSIAASSPRGGRRPRLILGLGLAGAAIALTAGTTTTAYYLGIPPFQSLPDGALRTTESIPLDYVTDDAIEIRCSIFLEFENVDAAEVATVDEAIATHDWADFGQDLYAAQGALPPTPRDSLNPQEEVSGAALEAVYDFAASSIPDLRLLGDGAASDPRLSAVATTCVPHGR